jgi:hypothetical protein
MIIIFKNILKKIFLNNSIIMFSKTMHGMDFQYETYEEVKQTNAQLEKINTSLNNQNNINNINFGCMLLLFCLTIYNFIRSFV